MYFFMMQMTSELWVYRRTMRMVERKTRRRRTRQMLVRTRTMM